MKLFLLGLVTGALLLAAAGAAGWRLSGLTDGWTGWRCWLSTDPRFYDLHCMHESACSCEGCP